MKTKTFISLICALALILTSVSSAFACTALYVGSDYTEDGTTMFGRIEDFGVNDYNKLFSVIPAGVHKAGDVYNGCFGFTYTFTHDSYGYTARMDDVFEGVCPDCGGTHDHTPYQEAGTNEKGVMVSATETLYSNEQISAVDPYEDAGIEEAEITTVLLSEAATAKEGVELLTSIYDTVGLCDGAGVFIADQNETWFVEAISGHTYIAVKLTSSVVFMQPNVAAIGKINLNDTENVIASANLISVAQEAGTFVGDADANIIDFNASYNGNNQSERMAAGLNYLYNVDTFTAENYTEEDFAMSNVAEDGSIVTLYSNIKPAEKLSADDVLSFFKTEPIGKNGNCETHVFQVSKDEPLETALVEWTTFDSNVYNAFVPYYPMLTTDTNEHYQQSVGSVAKSETQPESGDWYKGTYRGQETYFSYPENWTNSYYGVLDALANKLTYGEDTTDEEKAEVVAAFATVQETIYADFEDMKASVAAAATTEEKQTIATEQSSAMAQLVYDTACELYDALCAE